MTPQRRSMIPQRRRIFLGCEGESERGYGALMGDLLEEQGKRVHIDSVVLTPGAGNPLIIAELAVSKMRDRERRFGAYAVRALLIDSDTLVQYPTHRAQVEAIAERSKLHVIWQNPCLEALLLRHLPQCRKLQPPDTRASLDILKQRWPSYEKPMSALRLREQIDADCVRQAAKVEPGLAIFLKEIGFI